MEHTRCFTSFRNVDSLAPARLIHRAPACWPLRASAGSLSPRLPALRFALRGNLRLLYRAASQAAWLCSLHQTFVLPSLRCAIALVFRVSGLASRRHDFPAGRRKPRGHAPQNAAIRCVFFNAFACPHPRAGPKWRQGRSLSGFPGSARPRVRAAAPRCRDLLCFAGENCFGEGAETSTRGARSTDSCNHLSSCMLPPFVQQFA